MHAVNDYIGERDERETLASRDRDERRTLVVVPRIIRVAVLTNKDLSERQERNTAPGVLMRLEDVPSIKQIALHEGRTLKHSSDNQDLLALAMRLPFFVYCPVHSMSRMVIGK